MTPMKAAAQSEMVERLRDRANDKRPMPKPYNLLLDAAEHIEALEKAALQARRALATCYDVADWPADGKTKQDAAIAALDGVLRASPSTFRQER